MSMTRRAISACPSHTALVVTSAGGGGKDKRPAWSEAAAGIGRGRACHIAHSPRHEMPFSSRNEGSKCVSITRRAIFGGLYSLVDPLPKQGTPQVTMWSL